MEKTSCVQHENVLRLVAFCYKNVISWGWYGIGGGVCCLCYVFDGVLLLERACGAGGMRGSHKNVTF